MSTHSSSFNEFMNKVREPIPSIPSISPIPLTQVEGRKPDAEPNEPETLFPDFVHVDTEIDTPFVSSTPLVEDPPSISLPYNMELRPYQQDVWDYMMQDRPGLRALTIWPRRNGKDLIALNILIAKAIQRSGLYLYIGPLQTQTRQIVWMGSTNEGRKFLDFIPSKFIAKKRDSQMEVDLINGSLIKVVGSDQYDSLMGLNAIGAVFTEYSLQRPEAWDYIRPMMAENGGWALFNGTPRGLNHMHKMAGMAKGNQEWFYQFLTRNDTGKPSLDAIRSDREAGMRESLIEQEYYCSWTSSSEEAFIPLDLVSPCKDVILNPPEYSHAPRIFGCDVAYAAKGDRAVITYRQGRKVHFVRSFVGKDNQAFAKEISRLAKIYKPHAICVDAGRGEGVISRLEALGHSHIVHAIHFGGKVYVEGISDMKALMWSRMEDWFLSPEKPDMSGIDNHELTNEDNVFQDLARELSTPFKIIDEKNRVKVEPKSSLRSRGQSSPDLAESLGLTFAEEVEVDTDLTERQEALGITPEMLEMLSKVAQEETYNPLDYMDTLVQVN
jgi:hypothetical protein